MKNWCLLILLLITGNLFASKITVPCEPTPIELSGKLELQTFAGPPNYESIKNGDQIDRYYFLSLDQPIDVQRMPNDEYDQVTKDVKVLQIVVTSDDHYPKLRKLGVGARVKIQGTLFKRVTGHHHSRVLLEVRKIVL